MPKFKGSSTRIPPSWLKAWFADKAALLVQLPNAQKRDLLLFRAGTVMQQSYGRLWATPDCPTKLMANAKPKEAARNFTKPGFQEPKPVLLWIDEAVESQCAVTRTEAVSLYRSIRKTVFSTSLVKGSYRLVNSDRKPPQIFTWKS